MRKTALIALLAAVIAGCAGTNDPSRIAVLQNPESRQTVECRADAKGSFNYQRQIDNCIATYEKAGYKLVADSARP